MTDAELEEGLRICEAATPGCWEPGEGVIIVARQCPHCESDVDEDLLMELSVEGIGTEADLKFVAYARTALPAAFAELKAVRPAALKYGRSTIHVQLDRVFWRLRRAMIRRRRWAEQECPPTVAMDAWPWIWTKALMAALSVGQQGW